MWGQYIPIERILQTYSKSKLTSICLLSRTIENQQCIKKNPPVSGYLERETGLEPATSTLARLRSTN
jgi:hypothetical protein